MLCNIEGKNALLKSIDYTMLSSDIINQSCVAMSFDKFTKGSTNYRYIMKMEHIIWLPSGTYLVVPTGVYWGYERYDENLSYIYNYRADHKSSTDYGASGVYILEHDSYYRFTYSSYMHQNNSYTEWVEEKAKKKIEEVKIIGSIYANLHPEIVNGVIYESPHSFIKSISHRGYFRKGAIENTIPACDAAKQNGYLYIEVDVWTTSDGVHVLNHNATLSDGTTISSITYEELQTYVLGEGTEYETNVPTAEEFLWWCKKNGIHPYIEIKGANPPVLYAIVQKYGMQRNCTWISTLFNVLSQIKELDEHARLGLIGYDIESLATLSTGKNELFIDCQYGNISEELCTKAYNAGIGVEAYTLDDSQTGTIVNLAKMGVSGFTVDGGHCADIVLKNG